MGQKRPWTADPEDLKDAIDAIMSTVTNLVTWVQDISHKTDDTPSLGWRVDEADEAIGNHEERLEELERDHALKQGPRGEQGIQGPIGQRGMAGNDGKDAKPIEHSPLYLEQVEKIKDLQEQIDEITEALRELEEG